VLDNSWNAQQAGQSPDRLRRRKDHRLASPDGDDLGGRHEVVA